MKRLIPLLFLLMGSFAWAGQSEAEMIELAERAGYYQKDNRYIPQLSKALYGAFERLAQAQEDLAEGAALSLNKLFIMDSRGTNAFVVSSRDVGIRISNNVVFLSMPLIEKMIDLRPRYQPGKGLVPLTEKEKEVEINDGILRLVGIMAHELGHPMDYIMDYRGEVFIEDHYGTQADQAIELKADVEAVRILRRAGFPDDCLYRGLNRLFRGRSSSSLLATVASTHPQADFRLTSARLFLTLMRFDQGFAPVTAQWQLPLDSMRLIEKELANLESNENPLNFKAPQSLEDAVHRLERLVGSENWSDWQSPYSFRGSLGRPEFNRLLTCINSELEKIEKTGQPLNKSQLASFHAFLTLAIEADTKFLEAIDSEDDYAQSVRVGAKLPVLKFGKTHAQALNKLAIYRDPATLDFVKKTMQTVSDIDVALRLPLWLMNSSDYFADYAKPLVERIQWLTQQQGSEYRANTFVSELTGAMSNEMRVKALATLGKWQTLSMSHNTKAWYFLSSSVVNLPLPLLEDHKKNPIKQNNEFVVAYDRLRLVARSGKNPEAEKTIAEVKAFFEGFWEQRGYYATLELLMKDRFINWPLIARILDKDLNVALNQVEAAVRDYTSGRTHKDFESRVQPDQSVQIPGFQSDSAKSIRAKSDPLVGVTAENGGGAPEPGKSSVPMSYAELINTLDPRNLVEIRPTPGYNAPIWLKSSLGQHILGLKNPMIQNGDPQLAANAQMGISRYYFIKNAKERDQRFFKNLMVYLDKHSSEINKDKAIEAFALSFKAAHADMAILKLVTPENYSSIYLDNFDRLPLSMEVKRMWLHLWYFKDLPTPRGQDAFFPATDYNWLTSNRTNAERAFRLLHKYGIVDSPFHLIQVLRRIPNFDYHRAKGGLDAYFMGINNLSLVLQKQLQDYAPSELQPGELLLWAEMLTHFAAKKSKEVSSSPEIQTLRNLLVVKAEEVQWKDADLYQFFYKVTQSGSTPATDAFFEKRIRPLLTDKVRLRRIEGLLRTERLSGQELKFKSTQEILEPRLQVLEKEQTVARRDAFDLMMDLQKYAPEGSIAKDDYIEKIGWRLKLKGSELDGLIEDQKSQNWRKSNPLLVRAGSMISAEIARMNKDRRLEFLRYLINPKQFSLGIPDGVVKEFERIIYDGLMESARLGNSPPDTEKMIQKAHEEAMKLKYKVEALLRDSAPVERIPLIEVVLTAGAAALQRDRAWPYNLTRPFLGYEAESIDEKMLEAYLDIVPEHERAVSMAYLLSQSGQQKASVADIFELFGTVGVKFGQLASIWEIFGPEVSRETKRLKDHARALSKYQFLQYLKTNERALFDKIEDVEVLLGSASVKTVALVRLKTGRRVVLAVRGEHIREKIQSNLQLGKAFLQGLKRFNLEKKSSLLALLIDALEEQLLDEVDFTKEAEKIRLTQELLHQMNSDLKGEMHGWSFDIPAIDAEIPAKEGVFAMELAKGKTFDSLSPHEQALVGPMAVQAALKMLFNYGLFDPDRHKGNWLFDVENKKIHFLDVGQLETFSRNRWPWNWDDRMTTALFLKAVDEHDIEGLIRQALKMVPQGQNFHADWKGLRRDLAEVFAEASSSDTGSVNANSTGASSADASKQWIGVVTALAENGVPLNKKYLFGALKGLMVLVGEKYVSTEDFRVMLRTEVKSLLRQKIPLMLKESVFPSTEKHLQEEAHGEKFDPKLAPKGDAREANAPSKGPAAVSSKSSTNHANLQSNHHLIDQPADQAFKGPLERPFGRTRRCGQALQGALLMKH